MILPSRKEGIERIKPEMGKRPTRGDGGSRLLNWLPALVAGAQTHWGHAAHLVESASELSHQRMGRWSSFFFF